MCSQEPFVTFNSRTCCIHSKHWANISWMGKFHFLRCMGKKLSHRMLLLYPENSASFIKSLPLKFTILQCFLRWRPFFSLNIFLFRDRALLCSLTHNILSLRRVCSSRKNINRFHTYNATLNIYTVVLLKLFLSQITDLFRN